MADLSFFVSNLYCFKAPPFKTIVGLPDLRLTISISLKNTPFLKPVPKALEQASLAANLLAYESA